MTGQNPSMPVRGVPILGDVLRSFRRQKGWTQADLAEKAGCSKKTIENMEKSKNADLFILDLVATALDVSPLAIRADRPDPGEPATVTPAPGRKQIRVVHAGDINDVVLLQLLERYREVAGIKGEIIVLSLEEGDSFTLSLDVEEDDALRCVAAFLKGGMEPVGAKEIRLPKGFGLWPILNDIYSNNSMGKWASSKQGYVKRIIGNIIFAKDEGPNEVLLLDIDAGWVRFGSRDPEAVTAAIRNLASMMVEAWTRGRDVRPNSKIPPPAELAGQIADESKFDMAVMDLLIEIAPPDIVARVDGSGSFRLTRTAIEEYSAVEE